MLPTLFGPEATEYSGVGKCLFMFWFLIIQSQKPVHCRQPRLVRRPPHLRTAFLSP